MPFGRQGPLAKALTGAIGMTQEYRADRKAKKEHQAQVQDPDPGQADPNVHLQPPQHDQGSHSSEDEDDESWAQDLDELQTNRETSLAKIQTSVSTGKQTVEDITAYFLSSQDPPPYSVNEHFTKLSKPIILPQRRPGNRTRGFIHAFPPNLESRSVDSKAWLSFLNSFDKAIAKNRWFYVLDLSLWIADKVRLALQGISLIAKAVSLAIYLSIEVSRRTYIHSKTNKFLDDVNEHYFKPRGLYALVVKYKNKEKPDDGHIPLELEDIERHTVETISKREEQENKFWRGLMKGHAAKVEHEDEVPEFAELTFPYLDELSEADKESTIKQSGAWLTDYYDRQAASKFAMDHPESKLASVAPQREWASQYADPTNPKSQAGLVEIVSGGYLKGLSGRRRRQRRTGRLGIGSRLHGEPEYNTDGTPKPRKKRQRPISKLLRQDALYLMVADYPTAEEMEAVKRAVESLADD